ncbi:MAG: hypothetical protein AAGM67_12885, partial [Bacteroidota bacterium]
MMKEERTVTTKAGDTVKKCTAERVLHSHEFGRLKKRLWDVMTKVKTMKFTGFEQAVPFLEHRWTSHVQGKAFRNQLTKFGQTHAMTVGDFGSNASFRATNQTQGGFFNPAQATFCPLMIHFWDEVNGEMSRWAHACDMISDDSKHDHAFVQTIMRDAIVWTKEKMEEQGLNLQCVHTWSDGCREQFKNGDMFGFVSASIVVNGISAEWCFFCSCHGKGGSDAETSILHRLVRTIQNERGRIDSAREAHVLMDEKIKKNTFDDKMLADEKVNSLAERHLVWHSTAETERSKAIISNK